MNDTERLDFILSHIRLDDVGDEESCCGVVICNEELEEKLGFGPMIDGSSVRLATWGDDLRDVIDRAIIAHAAERQKEGAE